MSRPRTRHGDALVQRLLNGTQSPAIKRLVELAESPGVEISTAPPQPAREVVSTWAVRLWNATMNGRRVVGLVDLVRSLRELQPEDSIEQISLFRGKETGLAFFLTGASQPVGAVFTLRTREDEVRSERNLRIANGQEPSTSSVPDAMTYVVSSMSLNSGAKLG